MTVQTAAKHCDTPALPLFLDDFCRCGWPRLFLWAVAPRADWGAVADTHPAALPMDTQLCLHPLWHHCCLPPHAQHTQHSTKIISWSLMQPMEVRGKDWPATGRRQRLAHRILHAKSVVLVGLWCECHTQTQGRAHAGGDSLNSSHWWEQERK